MKQDQTPKPISYCLYARKSSESEERQALSIDSQIREMELIAKREGLNVVQVRKESHSAKERGDRLVFNEMVHDIRHQKFNAILTWAPDRLSRNAGDLGALVDLMDEKRLVEIRTFGQTFTNSPSEKFLLMILGSQAKLENDNRSVNVRRGMRARIEMGLWPGVAPLGYLNQNRTDKKCEVILDEARASIIKRVFEKVGIEKMSSREVYRWLGDIGFRTRGNKPLTYSGVQAMLNTPFYTGRFEYPRKSGKWYQGKHEPIISEDLYVKVQSQLHRYNIKRQHKEFSFTRLFICGLCESGIGATEKLKQLKDGTVSKYIYYGCNRGRDRYCKNTYIPEEELIKQLVEIFDQLDIDELGIRYKFEAEVTRCGQLFKFIRGQPMDFKPEEIELNIRAYAKYVLQDGSKTEKRELLSNIQSRIVYEDKRLRVLEAE